jgi:metal iron transporter
MNQNPNALSPALTTRHDLNGMANLKVCRRLSSIEHTTEDEPDDDSDAQRDKAAVVGTGQVGESQTPELGLGGDGPKESIARRLRDVIVTFGKFVGPGFMVSCPLHAAGRSDS